MKFNLNENEKKMKKVKSKKERKLHRAKSVIITKIFVTSYEFFLLAFIIAFLITSTNAGCKEESAGQDFYDMVYYILLRKALEGALNSEYAAAAIVNAATNTAVAVTDVDVKTSALTTTPNIIGGIAIVTVVVIGGYQIYSYYDNNYSGHRKEENFF